MYLGMIMQVVFAEQSEEELMGHCLDWGLLCYKNTILFQVYLQLVNYGILVVYF